MNKFVIRKVPLFTFITLLKEIYESGADFVDLNGIRNDMTKQDEITVSVPLEYMTPEAIDPPAEITEEEQQEENEKDIVDAIKNA